ncbi:hypothetical protein MD484_g4308, partial [Candolleomyces efflorescens]
MNADHAPVTHEDWDVKEILREEQAGKCPAGPECRLEVDVILRSSDGYFLGAHRSNLEQYSDGFPDGSTHMDATQPVDLVEDADTLKILLRFMHKQRYPKVSWLETTQIFALAEAAEKYMVYSAISACHDYIEGHVKQHPIESLCYAAKFNYPQIADAAAIHSICKSLDEIRKSSQNHHPTIYAWLQYREGYISVVESALNPPAPYINSRKQQHLCHFWEPYLNATMSELPRTTMQSLRLLAENKFSVTVYSKHSELVNGCAACPTRVLNWKRDILEKMESIPPFHTFI